MQYLSYLQACIYDVKCWSQHNYLKLNSEKTEVLQFVSKFRQSQQIDNVILDETVVHTATDSVRDLGVQLDKHLAMNAHVNNVCKAASLALYKIGTVRQYLSKEATERLVHAHVMSRIDYCNSVLYGLPDLQISKLQRIQNSAARLVVRAKKHEHVSPILQELHWLPVKARIQYKILSLAYLSLRGQGPEYLHCLITVYRPARNLRSQTKSLLVCPTFNTISYGARSFVYAAATLWNNLPEHIKQSDTIAKFRTSLKTHLFLK